MNEPRNGQEKYMRLMAGTELGRQLATPAGRRTALYDMLAEHPDPVWREMGQQLRTGHMRPSDMFAVPAYHERLLAGLEQAKARHEEMFSTLERAVGEESTQDRTPSAPPVPDRRTSAGHDDEADEIPIRWERR